LWQLVERQQKNTYPTVSQAGQGHRPRQTGHESSDPPSIQVAPLSCSIGAELRNIQLGAASRDPELVCD
jgi:hypothetical protein